MSKILQQPSAMTAIFPKGWREFPSSDPEAHEIWLYTDEFTYAPGDEVSFHVHTTAKEYSVVIEREGGQTESVYSVEGLAGKRQKTPDNAYEVGCGWDQAFTLTIPDNWKSGVYVVTVTAEDPIKGTVTGEHFFVVRAAQPSSSSKIALMLPTSTYLAYSDWGGANHYWSRDEIIPCPKLSTQRPWGRGFARLPAGYPRYGERPKLKPFEEPRYWNYEWALENRYSRHYASAGWAYYDSHFSRWAERNGYVLEYLTQHDLHLRPELLSNYELLVIVGHDEYWSWEMRDTLDNFLNSGGNLARFGGNFLWQIRLEDSGKTHVNYKIAKYDPLFGTDRQRFVSTSWDHPLIDRPVAPSLGLTGTAGIYNNLAGAIPRSSGGFTVYRQDHWAFEGTDLYFGDLFGERPTSIVAYEVDGLDFTFEGGLPVPTFMDGAPESTEILAMAPARKAEEDHSGGVRPIANSMEEFHYFDSAIEAYYPNHPDNQVMQFQKGRGLRAEQGCAAIITCKIGKGNIFNAGTCCWIHGLIDNEFFTEQITRNVLNTLSSQVAPDLVSQD